ncbi:MAG TPA: hypothetical protein VF184_00895 [Phycisphaeraceae bacterium]
MNIPKSAIVYALENPDLDPTTWVPIEWDRDGKPRRAVQIGYIYDRLKDVKAWAESEAAVLKLRTVTNLPDEEAVQAITEVVVRDGVSVSDAADRLSRQAMLGYRPKQG